MIRYLRLAPFISLVLVLETAYSLVPINGRDDVWTHAAIGRWIVVHHHVPTHTLFLWSASQHWIAHSWLSELMMYCALAHFGDSGGCSILILVTVILVGASLLISMLPILRSAGVPVLFFLLAPLAVRAGSLRFQARPDLCSTLLFAVTLAILECWRPVKSNDYRGNRPLLVGYVAMPLVFALWSNLHGAVVLGLGLIAIQVVADLVQYGYKPGTVHNGGSLLACIAAVALNPYGVTYYAIYLEIHSRVFQSITEWTPVFSNPIVLEPVLETFLLVGIALFMFAGNPNRRWTRLAWPIAFSGAYLLARRNAFLLVLVCLSTIAQDVAETSSAEADPGRGKKNPQTNLRSASRRQRLTYVCASILTVAALVLSPIAMYGASFRSVALGDCPVNISNLLLDRGVRGNVYVDNFGTPYLEWKLADRISFSIDGINAYPDSLMTDSENVLQANQTGLTYLRKHDVNCIVGRIPEANEALPPMYDYLVHSPEWSEVDAANEGPVWFRAKSHLR